MTSFVNLIAARYQQAYNGTTLSKVQLLNNEFNYEPGSFGIEDYISSFSSGLNGFNVRIGSVDFERPSGAIDFKDKTVYGDEVDGAALGDEGQLSRLTTAYFTAFKEITKPHNELDLLRMRNPILIAKSLERNVQTLHIWRQRAALQALCYSQNGIELDGIEQLATGTWPTTTDFRDLVAKITTQIKLKATEIANSYNFGTGLGFLSKDQITIHVNPSVLTAFNAFGQIDTRTVGVIGKEPIQNIPYLGGFKVVENRLLVPASTKRADFNAWRTANTNTSANAGLQSKDFKPVYVIIGSNVSIVSPYQVVRAGIYNVTDGSGDIKLKVGAYLSSNSVHVENGATIIVPEHLAVFTSATALP